MPAMCVDAAAAVDVDPASTHPTAAVGPSLSQPPHTHMAAVDVGPAHDFEEADAFFDAPLQGDYPEGEDAFFLGCFEPL